MYASTHKLSALLLHKQISLCIKFVLLNKLILQTRVRHHHALCCLQQVPVHPLDDFILV